MFINAGSLFGRATSAYDRARSGGTAERKWGVMDALESVVFSVIALEGFMNEAADLASQDVLPGQPEPDSVQHFTNLMSHADKGRASLILKFQLIRLSFAGETYDVSCSPFQDFSLLIELRNALVHYRSTDRFGVDEEGVFTFTPAPLLTKLRSKNILAEFGPKDLASWIVQISTVAVAGWSCGVASSMVYSVLDALPDSHFKEQMELYRNAFEFSS